MTHSKGIIEITTGILKLQTPTSDVPAIAKAAKRLEQQQRKRLVRTIHAMLCGASRRRESERVVSAKVLTALLPESLGTIKRCLITHTDRWWYEVHFSLFC